jgi:hypothetical protein
MTGACWTREAGVGTQPNEQAITTLEGKDG